MRLVALDEQRHIGFGVKLLHDLARRGAGRPRRGRRPACARSPRTRSRSSSRPTGTAPTPSASASRSRRSTPRARARSSRSCAPRACRWSRCPARRCSRWSSSHRERAEYGLAMLRAGFLGPGNGAPPRDPAAMELLFGVGRPRGRPPHRARGPVHRPVGVRRRRAVAPARRQRLHRRAPPAGPPTVDLEVRCRYDGLGRRRRRPARSAPRARHPPAAPARLAARPVGRPRAVLSDQPVGYVRPIPGMPSP